MTKVTNATKMTKHTATRDVTVVGLTNPIFEIRDIGESVPEGVTVRIPAAKAHTSKDLWLGISQKKLFVVKSGVAVMTPAAPPATSQSTDEPKSPTSDMVEAHPVHMDLKGRFERLQTDYGALTEKCNQLIAERDTARSDKKLLENQVSSLSKEIGDLQTALAKEKEKNEALTAVPATSVSNSTEPVDEPVEAPKPKRGGKKGKSQTDSDGVNSSDE